MSFRVLRVRQTLKAIKKEKQRHARNVANGLKKAGAFLLRKSLAVVPVDHGDLRASSFIRATGEGLETEVRIGYTAEHAVVVHERTDLRHGQEFNRYYAAEIAAGRTHSRGPDQQAKYLEEPVRLNHNEAKSIIVTESKKK